MRIPDQAPAVARNRRSGPVRRFARRWTEADGVRPSQYGGEEGEAGEEDGVQSGDDEGGEEGGEEDATVDSE